MSIYEALLVAHLGSTAVLLVVLCLLVAAHRVRELARGRATGAEGDGPRPDAPASSELPQPASAPAAKDVLPHRGRGVLHPSS